MNSKACDDTTIRATEIILQHFITPLSLKQNQYVMFYQHVLQEILFLVEITLNALLGV